MKSSLTCPSCDGTIRFGRLVRAQLTSFFRITCPHCRTTIRANLPGELLVMITIIGGSAALAAVGLYLWHRIGLTAAVSYFVGFAALMVIGIGTMALWIARRAHLVALEHANADWGHRAKAMVITAIALPLSITALLWFDGTIEMYIGHRHVLSLNSGGDVTTAVRWLERAAAKGDATAMWQLALLYHHGRGVEKDYAEAMRWYIQAAEAGDANANYAIGRMYANGEGVEKDETKYRQWMEKAAKAGSAAAERELQQLRELNRDAP